jgi:hypothetical protein
MIIRPRHYTILPLILLCFICMHSSPQVDWGFYAHKLINRMAIYTLPGDLIEFYKSNADYISNHAIDPDKRRYAVKGEAIRHYIDLDHWSTDSVAEVPKDFFMALIKYNHFYYAKGEEKILLFDTLNPFDKHTDSLFFSDAMIRLYKFPTRGMSMSSWRQALINVGMKYYDEESWRIPCGLLNGILPFANENDHIEIDDRFSKHGILPYHLEKSYYQLIDAFKTKSKERILRLSADIGHYVGDAHVPLHTTKNYNGQLTNQDGIHAFWESRIPELFAESEFDFVVGPAIYISTIRTFIWDIIYESHSGVSLVLDIEKDLSNQTPADQQFCYDERLGVITKIQCREYSARYHELLDRQVEERMRSCILNLGSIWMSAWVEAGQPDLKFDDANVVQDVIQTDTLNPKSRFQIREHE